MLDHAILALCVNTACAVPRMCACFSMTSMGWQSTPCTKICCLDSLFGFINRRMSKSVSVLQPKQSLRVAKPLEYGWSGTLRSFVQACRLWILIPSHSATALDRWSRCANCLTAAILNRSIERFPLIPSPSAHNYGSGLFTVVVAIYIDDLQALVVQP
jgi:hypothetical protein